MLLQVLLQVRPLRRLGSPAFRAMWPDVPADPASGSHRVLRRAVCPVVPAAVPLREVSSLKARALPEMSRRAACPAVAWRRQDVHHQDVHHPDDRQAGVRRAPLSELPALRGRALLLREAAASRGVLRELRPVQALAAYAQPGVEAAEASPDVAVLGQAAVSDARELRPAAAGSASPVQPRAAPAGRARRAVRGERELPRAAEAEWGAQVQRRAEVAASGVPEQQPVAAVAASRALRPAAARDAQAARLPEVVPADAARLRAVPDAREHPARAVASAFRPDRFLPLAAPARRPAARFGRATLRWRIASPSAQSWQAARDEALSWSWSPRAESSGQERKQ
ncbi:hypothetical protein [Bradyrhizobium sp. 27S5]|uniref:hypothetical protein n=1 Tax=Bradyrhizobium sp. 27S5 TaxID=3139728 RepID=UPI0039C8541B